MNYTEIAAAHELEYNRPDKTALTSQWVEDSYRDVMSRRKFSWLIDSYPIDVVANTFLYSLPTDFYAVIDLIFNNGTTESWPINLYTPEEFNILHPNVNEDTPSKLEDGCIVTSIDINYLSTGKLMLWPKPDSSAYELTLRYEVVSPALSGVLIPLIPARYHQVLVFGSLNRGFAHVREYEAAMYWEKRYEQMIARMIEDDKYTPDRQRVMKPFTGGMTQYPPDYWKKYTVRGVR